jgi:hypothetical protein
MKLNAHLVGMTALIFLCANFTSADTRHPAGAAPIRPIQTPTSNTTHPPFQAPASIRIPRGDECGTLSRWDMPRPRIVITGMKNAGNFFGSQSTVEGTIEGICLVEAGLFERGRKQHSIPVTPQIRFRRFKFIVPANLREYPEIRAYNYLGDYDYFPIQKDSDEYSLREEYEQPRRQDDYYYERNQKVSGNPSPSTPVQQKNRWGILGSIFGNQ